MPSMKSDTDFIDLKGPLVPKASMENSIWMCRGTVIESLSQNCAVSPCGIDCNMQQKS